MPANMFIVPVNRRKDEIIFPSIMMLILSGNLCMGVYCIIFDNWKKPQILDLLRN